jgi:hypothetical protein
MNFNNDISIQYLDKLYEDLNKEQMKILADIKTGTDDKKSSENEKEFKLIYTLLINTLKLRNIKKKHSIENL